MPYAEITAWPFILHTLIELPACFAFALFPSATLSTPQPHAHALIRQYAVLLLSTNLIAGSFIFRSHKILLSCDDTGYVQCWVAFSLALYHLGPLMRAGSRIWEGWGRMTREKDTLAMPWVHAMSHLVCLTALAGRSVDFW